jgi:hypothetical protein
MSFTPSPLLHDLHAEAAKSAEALTIPAIAHEVYVHAYAERILLERYLAAQDRIRELEAK